MNAASYNMYKHNIAAEKSLFKRFLKRPETIPLIFFITSLTLWLAFLSKVYFENRSEQEISLDAASLNNSYEEPLSTQAVIYETVSSNQALVSFNTVNANINKINQLTKQLMRQQQQTEELTRMVNMQKMELGLLIDDAVKKANITDKNYIADLSKLENTSNERNETDLANTDYYNRVTITSSSKSSNYLQNKINSFLIYPQGEKKKNTGYVKQLNKESNVRTNEARSITLKKGESIWMIAKRAYGDGYLYHKIMKANPQITERNAHYLTPGTIIRVPI